MPLALLIWRIKHCIVGLAFLPIIGIFFWFLQWIFLLLRRRRPPQRVWAWSLCTRAWVYAWFLYATLKWKERFGRGTHSSGLIRHRGLSISFFFFSRSTVNGRLHFFAFSHDFSLTFVILLLRMSEKPFFLILLLSSPRLLHSTTWLGR